MSELSVAGGSSLNEGLIAYYSFDDGTARDVSGNSHNGVMHGNPKVIDGVIGRALYFDGEDDYIELDDFPEDFTKGITIVAWVRFDEPRYWSRIIDLGNGAASDNILFAEVTETNDLCFEVYNDYGAINNRNQQKVIVEDGIVFGRWMFVAAVGRPEGDVLKVSIYIDGEEKAVVNYYGNPDNETNVPRRITRTKNYIAKSNWSVDELFKGAIDELRIYNRPLTKEEVTQLYLAGGGVLLELKWKKDIGEPIFDAEWSTRGDLLAVPTTDGVILYHEDGAVLWQKNGLSSDKVFDVSWSPDSTKLALVTGDDRKLVVLTANTGSKIWEKDLGKSLFDLAWGSNTIAAGGYDNTVFTLTQSGSITYQKSFCRCGLSVEGLAWSPDGEKLTVGVDNNLLILDNNGNLIAEIELSGDDINHVAWSPDAGLVAIGLEGGSSSGIYIIGVGTWGVIWSDTTYGDVASQIHTSFPISWSPGGRYLVFGAEDGSLVIYRRDGVPVKELELGSPVMGVSWSSRGLIAVATYDGKVRVYEVRAGERSALNILGSEYGLRACVYSVPSVLVGCYEVGAEGLRVEVEPGDYEVRYYLTGLPSDYIFVGDAYEYFESHPVTMSVHVEAGKAYSVSPPTINEFLGMLGRVVINGLSDVGVRVEVSWPYSKSREFDVPAGGSVEVYAVPGEYAVKYYLTALPEEGEFVGGAGNLASYPVSRVLEVEGGEDYLLNSPGIGEFFGRLILQAPEGLDLAANVSWGSGSMLFNVSAGASLAVLAVPGDYEIEFSVREASLGPDLIGPTSRLMESSVTAEVSVKEPGDNVYAGPSLGDFLGTLTISSLCNVVATVSWDSGNITKNIGAGSSVEWAAIPGKYIVILSPVNITSCLGIGNIGDIEGKAVLITNATVSAGSETRISYFPKDLVGTIEIVNTLPFHITVDISWGTGNKELELDPWKNSTSLAAPGNYYLQITVSENILGLPNQINTNASVTTGSVSIIDLSTISPLDSVGQLVIRNGGEVPVEVNVSWGGGSRVLHLDPGGSVSLFAVAGSYEVASKPLYDVAGYAPRLREVSVSAGSEAVFDAGVKAGKLVVSGPGSVEVRGPGGVVWSGSGGSSVWLVPGEYTVLVRYSGEGEGFVGPVDEYVVNVSLSMSAGGSEEIDIEEMFRNGLKPIVVEGPAGAPVRVVWDGGEKAFTIPPSGRLEVLAVPGTEYRVVSPSSDMLHASFVASVTGGGHVLISYPYSNLFYGLIVAIGSAVVTYAVARPRVRVRVLTKEIVVGLTDHLEVEVYNPGFFSKEFVLAVEVGGEKVFEERLALKGRERRVLRVRLPGGGGGG